MTNLSKQYDLYFGRNIDNGRKVQVYDFEAFLADNVTARFPGFTIIKANGFWKGEREQVFILRIIGDGVDSFAVNKIADAYKAEFKQESVLIVKTDIQGFLV